MLAVSQRARRGGRPHTSLQRLSAVRLVAWGAGDLELLRSCNTPEMQRYLGGPESPDALQKRQLRYQSMPESQGRVFKVLAGEPVRAAGSVVYWDRDWRGEGIFEIGWMVLPEFQGRGIGVAAVAQAIEHARADARHPSLHAFPYAMNAASNAVCRRLGFTDMGAEDVEFRGVRFRVNDWRLGLAGARA